MLDIQGASPERYEAAVKIRDDFFKYDPALSEEIKYGGLVFFQEKELVGGIFFYKAHLSIEFSQGVALSDPHSVLEGKGKLRRHIKIRTVQDLLDKKVAHYIEEALAKG